MLSLLLVVLITAVWWANNLSFVTGQMNIHLAGEMIIQPEDMSLWGGVTYYIRSFPFLVTGLLAAASLMLLPLFFQRTAPKERWVILLWLFMPLLCHFVLKVRHFRYLFPLVPAVAVVVGAGLCALRRVVRRAVAGGLGGLLFISYLACSFFIPTDTTGDLNLLRRGPRSLASYWLTTCDDVYAGIPCHASPSASWLTRPAEEIVSEITRRHTPRQEVLLIYQWNKIMPETTFIPYYVQSRAPWVKLCELSRWARRTQSLRWGHHYLILEQGRAPSLPARKVKALRNITGEGAPPEVPGRGGWVLWKLVRPHAARTPSSKSIQSTR